MRLNRILLFVVAVAAAAAFAGAFASSASALAFADYPCPIAPPGTIKICGDGEVGKAYSLHVDGRNGTGCYPHVKYKVIAGTALPPGLSMSSDGWITGIPTTAGKYDFWLSMTDTNGDPSWCTDSESTEREFQMTIVQGLQIQQREGTLTPAQLNTPYSLQLTTNSSSALTWSVSSGALPTGINVNTSTGLLSGTPTQVQDSHFQIKVSDGNRSDVQTYNLSVVQALLIAAPPTAAEVGLPVNVTLKATGGRAPYTWAATGLPVGLTLDPASGAVTGTPTQAGAAAVKVTVTDSLGLTKQMDVNLVVAGKLALAKTPLAPATVGVAYSQRLVRAGGVTPIRWTIIGGTVPAGIKLGARTGKLAGVPKKAGTYHFRVQVVDRLGAHSTLGVVLKVAKSSKK